MSVGDRMRGIGGSDAPAILGLSPWRTPVDVYMEKIGEAPQIEDTPAMYWGRALENVLAEEYARRTNARLRRVNRTLVHREHPFLIGHIDREVVANERGPGVLEVKTAGRLTDEWGEPGTDEVPEHYLVQVQHYLAVTGRAWADLAVLFLTEREFRIYHVPRDNDLVKVILAEEIRFWREHVEPQVPPPPRSLDDLRRVWPRHRPGSISVASPEITAAAAQLAALRGQIKALEARADELVFAIQQAMADAEELHAEDGRVLATWKSVTTRSIDTKALANAHPDIVSGFMKEKASRRFLLKIGADKEQSA
jgi:putative phage-type endonuclease